MCRFRVLGLVFAAGMVGGALSVVAQGSPAAGSCHWQWKQVDKHEEMAVCTSVEGKDTLEILFDKKEYGWMGVGVSEPVEVKNPKKPMLRQLGENKLAVTLSFDDGKRQEEKWGATDRWYGEDGTRMAIAQLDGSSKPFAEGLKSKKLTVSFKDSAGDPVTATFDLSDMATEMQAHKAHVHHFGLSDVAGGLTGF